MSFLAQVISSAETVELLEIDTSVPKVVAATELCLNNLTTYIQNVYENLTERPKRNDLLFSNASRLQEETTTLIAKVETNLKKEISNVENDLDKHLSTLKQTNLALKLVGHICNVHKALTEIKDLHKMQMYVQCMEKIRETNTCIKNIPPDEKIAVLKEMVRRVVLEQSLLETKLAHTFNEYVLLSEGEARSSIEIKPNQRELKDILLALLSEAAITPLDNVTRFLWNQIFVPIVDFTVEIETAPGSLIIHKKCSNKSAYKKVFSDIKTVLTFLNDNFSIQITDELSTLSYIGADLRDNLSELLIKHCLQGTIPSTDEGLQEYSVVIAATEELQQALVESHIFAAETTSILEYANNIDILFINKKCHDYVIGAQELMKKDLHDMVEVGEHVESVLEAKAPFPKCSISKGVQELVVLLEKILLEATTSSDVCAGRLFCTVKNISLKYVYFAPEFHRKLMSTIPQQIAIFYNNCLYIAFKLSEWNSTHCGRLPALLNVCANRFEDEVHQLENVAADMFTAHVSVQTTQIQEIMKNTGLEQHLTLEVVEPIVEKSIRQCLRQQEILKTVWQKVLPYEIYNQTLGLILDSLCGSLLATIVKFEDISTEAAEQLVEILRMVQTRGPKLFTDAKEVSLFVGSWYKLGELVFVLNGSLIDINDRWADGKGPLALQFKAGELKQLIRALFQGTERRAALLSKII